METFNSSRATPGKTKLCCAPAYYCSESQCQWGWGIVRHDFYQSWEGKRLWKCAVFFLIKLCKNESKGLCFLFVGQGFDLRHTAHCLTTWVNSKV